MIAIALLCSFVLLALGLASFLISRRGGTAGVSTRIVPDGDAFVAVRGWNQVELEQILAAIAQSYDLPREALLSSQQRDGSYAVTFPQGVQAAHLFFLVNYLHYPVGFDLDGRKIAVAGNVTLTEAFGVPDAAMLGRAATIYVPADDADYDLVFVQVQPGATYSVPFTNLSWNETKDPRMPLDIMEMRRTARE